MAVAVGRIHRCQRIIIDHDHIGSGSHFQNTKRFLKITIRNLCISLKQHLRNFTPCCCRITEMVFMQNVCHFPGLHHIMGISVCTKARQNALVYQFHRRRTSTGIPHIRFRIVHYHCICLFDQIHLVFIDINTVSEKSLRTKNIPVIKAVDDTFAVLFQTLMQIINPLCHMDVITDTFRFQLITESHRLIRDCKRCMHSHHGSQHITVIFTRMPDEVYILHHRFP